MKQSLARVAGIYPPPDGYTPEEKAIEKLIGEASVATLYAKLPTHRMKAIVAMYFELGYPQEVVADVFGITQEAVNYEIDIIRRIFLGKKHRPQKGRNLLTVQDIMETILVLSRA